MRHRVWTALVFVLAISGSVGAQDATLDDLLDQLEAAVRAGDKHAVAETAQAIATRDDPSAVPRLIAILDADNTPDTIYQIGWFALTPLTGVRYDHMHHGPWWRKWWAAHRAGFPEDVRSRDVPDLEKTDNGRAFAANPPKAESIILEPTLDQLLERLADEVQAGDRGLVGRTARWIAEFENPRAVPVLIDLIARDASGHAIYWIGWFGLSPLTGVDYDEAHDGAWWKAWWEGNKVEFEVKIAEARAKEPPSGNLRRPRHEKPLPDAEDVADVPATDTLIGGDPFKRYVLIGAPADTPAPKDGYRLVVLMPGGHGGPDFHPFIKRIWKHVFSTEYLIAQVVAPEWDPRQAEKIVWPTRTNPYSKMKFTTEELVDAVIDDVERRYRIDSDRVYTFSWSSSGPAAYAISLQPKTRVRGSFVAMSVFRPEWLPDLDAARGQAYFILHSPDDFIELSHAEAARDRLAEHGARTTLLTYPGGHGWRGNVYGNMREGFAWLTEGAEESDE